MIDAGQNTDWLCLLPLILTVCDLIGTSGQGTDRRLRLSLITLAGKYCTTERTAHLDDCTWNKLPLIFLFPCFGIIMSHLFTVQFESPLIFSLRHLRVIDIGLNQGSHWLKKQQHRCCAMQSWTECVEYKVPKHSSSWYINC